jgi:hypothetical protein
MKKREQSTRKYWLRLMRGVVQGKDRSKSKKARKRK